MCQYKFVTFYTLMFNFKLRTYLSMNILVVLMSLFGMARSRNYSTKSFYRMPQGSVNNVLDARKKCLPDGILASLHEDKLAIEIEFNIALFRKFLKLLNFVVTLANNIKANVMMTNMTANFQQV